MCSESTRDLFYHFPQFYLTWQAVCRTRVTAPCQIVATAHLFLALKFSLCKREHISVLSLWLAACLLSIRLLESGKIRSLCLVLRWARWNQLDFFFQCIYLILNCFEEKKAHTHYIFHSFLNCLSSAKPIESIFCFCDSNLSRFIRHFKQVAAVAQTSTGRTFSLVAANS